MKSSYTLKDYFSRRDFTVFSTQIKFQSHYFIILVCYVNWTLYTGSPFIGKTLTRRLQKCNLVLFSHGPDCFCVESFWLGQGGVVCEFWATRVCLTVQLPWKRMRKTHTHIWRAQIASEWWAGFGPHLLFKASFCHEAPPVSSSKSTTAQAELPGRPVQPSNKSEVIHTSFDWSFNHLTLTDVRFKMRSKIDCCHCLFFFQLYVVKNNKKKKSRFLAVQINPLNSTDVFRYQQHVNVTLMKQLFV